MSTVFKICNEEDNKVSGFEFSEIATYRILFDNEEVRTGRRFQIGIHEYEISEIYICTFGSPRLRETIDNEASEMSTHIWICCKTQDPRLSNAGMSELQMESIKSDLNIDL